MHQVKSYRSDRKKVRKVNGKEIGMKDGEGALKSDIGLLHVAKGDL